MTKEMRSMPRRMRSRLLLAAAAPLAMVAATAWPGSTAEASAPGLPAHYHLVNLGGLSPGATGAAMAINDRGEVVGYSTSMSGYTHPFLWRHGVMTDLGALEPGSVEYGVAIDINNRGEVIGSGDVYGGTAMHAFLWRDGVMRDLGTLGGRQSSAIAINDRGQVLGVSDTGSGTYWHAFLWEDGRMRDLGVTSVAGLNNRGDVIGGADHAYLLRQGVRLDLGTLPGGTFSEAHAINNLGWVTGDADTAARPQTRSGFLWRNGTMSLLPALPGSTYETATTLNDRGQVLGSNELPDGTHWVVWQNAAVVDLTARGVPPATGLLRDINRSAQIVGSYYFTYGNPGPALFR